MANSSQLNRLAENTMYHYDAAFFYEGVASGEIVVPIDPEFPPPDLPPPPEALMARSGNGNGRNGRRIPVYQPPAEGEVEGEARAAPPGVGGRAFTPEEIDELNALSNEHLSAAIQLDEVIAEIAETQEGEEALSQLERMAPKRNAVSALRSRSVVPGRPRVNN